MSASVTLSRARLALAGVIAGIAALRLMLSIVPDTTFDVDPLTAGFTYAGIGPAVSVFLDALMVFVAAIALELERRRRGLDGWLLVLVALPLIPLAWHAWHDALDFWRGADWFAGATAAAAMAHLARSNRCRELALAIIFGAVVATALRGGWQIFVEHSAMVQHFEENKDDVLAMQGWADGSNAAEIYERRLRQPEATGWVGFSNITSGIYGAAAVGLLCLALYAGRRREQLGTVVGLLLLALALAVLLGLNASKGAILATVVALVILIGFVLPGPSGSRIRSLGGVILLVCAAVAVFTVVVRGLLPEGFLGEKSLLFRWHYTSASARMFAEAPLVGVGPDGFQDAYGAARSIRSPEVPVSAHSAWLDWLVTLGPLGLSWVGVVVVLFLRRPSETTTSPQSRVPTIWAAIFGLVVFMFALLVQLYVESSVLDKPSEIIRIVGAVLAMSTTILVVDGFRHAPEGTSRLVALSAAIVFAAQGQIEMVFWQPGSVVLAWVVLGLAGTAATRECKTSEIAWPIGGVFISGVLLFGAILLGLSESQMRRSASSLLELAVRETPPSQAEVEEARWLAANGLSAGVVEDGHWWDRRRLRAATSQFGMLPTVEDREKALEIAEGWVHTRPGSESMSRRAAIARAVYAKRRDEASLNAAIDATWMEVSYQPYAPMPRVRLAELFLEVGNPVGAAAQLDEAERLNMMLELDPLAQFGDADQARIERARERARLAE